MDDEEENYYFLSDLLQINNLEAPSIGNQSPERKPISEKPMMVKAFNPMEQLQKLPQSKRQSYYHLFMNSKVLPGLKGVFSLGDQEQIPQFLASIQDGVIQQAMEEEQSSSTFFDFPGSDKNEAREQIEETIKSLKARFEEIQKKIFKIIGINKTIGIAFYNHFDNFTYLKSEQSFIKGLEISMINMIQHAKTIKGPGIQLISFLYDYWMKVFKDFILQIWKHSEKYTLNFLKKVKDADSSSNFEGRSSTSSKVREEKRKPWKMSELELLQKIINSGIAFNQARLNELGEEMGRSTASISSKIQKIIKQKKQQIPEYGFHDTASLTDKIIEVLQNYPDGLPREAVIERMKEHYEMGFDTNWQKSVSQILSSKKEIIKVKGTFSLKGNHNFDINKKTFKDKVINCFLSLPDRKADMKSLVEKYINIYGKMEGISILTEERRKTIEASISKSLSRYDIFDKSSSKTVYRLIQLGQENSIDIQDYFL